MHKLLLRQLKKLKTLDKSDLNIRELIDAVDHAYQQFDHDRILLERSLELTSLELNERNQLLRSQVSKLERTTQKMEQSLSTLNATFNSTGEAIFDVNNNKQKVMLNSLARKMLYINSNQTYFSYLKCIKRFFKLALDSDTIRYDLKEVQANLNAPSFGLITFKNGKIYEYHSSPKIENHKNLGRVWCFRDVTEIKENQATIQHQAFHDALTNLPNRVLLNDRIKHAITIAKRDHQQMVILFIDLDKFKKVNDTAGHLTGDKLLTHVVDRINDCLRDQDTLARLGGDEFVVMLENIGSASSVTSLCYRLIEAIKLPFTIEEHEFHISASIGVSIYPRDGNEPEELIRKADISMYHAKEMGRSNFQFFDVSLERFAIHQLELENDLRYAIENNELDIHYQPKVCLKTGKILSCEALARWKRKGNYLSPTEFITVAEQTGLIYKLGNWIFEKACKQIKEWQALNLPNFRVAVNVSPKEFRQSNFLQHIEQTLSKHQINGECLELEITESTFLNNMSEVQFMLTGLKQLGLQISIDDFGTGYSSIRYLQQLPIDFLKIDKAFVLNLCENEQDRAIVRSVVALGHNLGQKIVAEGVQNEQTNQFLRECGCDIAQGFYYFKPMGSKALTLILNNPLSLKKDSNNNIA